MKCPKCSYRIEKQNFDKIRPELKKLPCPNCGKGKISDFSDVTKNIRLIRQDLGLIDDV